MEANKEACFDKEILNEEDEKSMHENGDNESPSVKRKSLHTVSSTNFNVNALPFVSRSEKYVVKSNDLYRKNTMNAPVPHVVPIPHGTLFNMRIRRCLSSHRQMRYFDQSQSQENYEHRPVLSNSMTHGIRNSMDERDSPRSCGPIALPNGTIQVILRNGIRVDITLDKAVRLTNSRSRITMSLSSNGGSAALIHPNGKVYQFGSFVEIVAYDGNEMNNYVSNGALHSHPDLPFEIQSRQAKLSLDNSYFSRISILSICPLVLLSRWVYVPKVCTNDALSYKIKYHRRYAKMWHKGISFTRENCALIYLIDPAGTRTTSDSFSNMRSDYSLPVFLNDSRHGPVYAKDAISVLQRSTYWCSTDGTEEFHINDFRITQTPDGLVKLVRPSHQWLIKTSSRNSSATLTTPQLHCTASLSQNSHLFVRRQEKRVHFDGSNFVVRNESQSAGFDENNLLKVY